MHKTNKNGRFLEPTSNATIMLGRRIDPARIISEYEWTGAVLYGAAGIQPYAVGWFFRNKGYKVTVTSNTDKLDKQARENTANVLFYWHKSGAHNVAVRWNGREFIGYNTFSGSDGPDRLGSSLKAFLTRNHYTGAILTSIS